MIERAPAKTQLFRCALADLDPGSTRLPTALYRAATPADLDPLMAAETACFPGKEWSRDYLQWCLADSQNTVWLCEFPGRGLVAWSVWQAAVSNWLDLSSLAVTAPWRRRGMATEMLERALASAQIVGFTGVRLEVQTGNLAAKGLYANLGFRFAGPVGAPTKSGPEPHPEVSESWERGFR